MNQNPRQNRLAVILSGAALVTSLGWNAVPALASAIAANSDKVDGLHAVHSNASVADRKGKLVATNPHSGRLPNNIIATAPNAKKLSGHPKSYYESSAHAATTYLPTATAGTTYLAKPDAAGTYLSKADAASSYLTKSAATATYPTFGNLANNRADYLLATNGQPATFTYPSGAQTSVVAGQTVTSPRAGHVFVQMSTPFSFACATASDVVLYWLDVDGTPIRSSRVYGLSETTPATIKTLFGVTDTSVAAGDHTILFHVGCTSSNWASYSSFGSASPTYAVVVPNSFVTPASTLAAGRSGPGARTVHAR